MNQTLRILFLDAETARLSYRAYWERVLRDIEISWKVHRYANGARYSAIRRSQGRMRKALHRTAAKVKV